MIKYKLTTQILTTYYGFQWEVGKKEVTSGKGKLCGPGYLHYYHDPLLAAFMNQINGGILNTKLFKVEAGGSHLNDHGLKGGCTEMTLLEEMKFPIITTHQRIVFAILCSKIDLEHQVWKVEVGRWFVWANDYLSGKDRSAQTAGNIHRSCSKHLKSSALYAVMAAYEINDFYVGILTGKSVYGTCSNESNDIDFIKLAKEAITYK